MRKVGILGGSFNPPHMDHINLGIFVKNSFKLDEVWLLPSNNPLKDPSKYVAHEHRLKMSCLAISEFQEEGLRISGKDLDRGDQSSYMIDTLRELREENPGIEFSLIIGSDSLGTLSQWKDWRSLIEEFDILVVPRPSYDTSKEWIGEKIGRIKYLVHLVTQGFSSTDLRRWAKDVQEGKSIGDKVKAFPPGVLEYIIKNKLYQ